MTRRIENSHPAHPPTTKAAAGKAKPTKATPTRQSEAAKKAESAERLERSYTLSDAHVKKRELLAGDATFSKKEAVSSGLALPAAAREIVDYLPVVRRQGEVEKKVHLAGGEVKFENEVVQAEASWDGVYAYAGAKGAASLGGKGLLANGELYVGAGLADAEATALLSYGPVQADLSARAFAGAKANVIGHVTVDPLRGVYYAEVGGQAFAGAKAGVSGTAHLGPVGNVGGTAEVWAGAGVQLKGRAGLKDGHFKFKVDMGAAMGIGFKLGAEVDLNLKPLGNLVKSVVELVSGGPSAASAVAVAESVVTIYKGLHPAAR